MDYSALVTAIKNGDEATANRLCEEATPILRRYLIARMGASKEDAEDCVQFMFEYVIEKIRKNEFSNPKGLLSYMLTSCRHNYLKLKNITPNDSLNELNDPVVESDQLRNLLNEDKLKILSYCIDQLNSEYRQLAKYLLKSPNAETEDVARDFNITINNAWIRKHRLIKRLRDCIEQNL